LSKVSEEVPSEIKKAISTVQSATDKIHWIGEQNETLRHSVLDHVRDVKPMVEDLGKLTEQLQELEKHSKYLAYVARVEELRWLVSIFFVFCCFFLLYL
jgi:chemotaxis regulatin CheY-phosphate phosphatase CheZ